jgi:hypothetical protein
MDRKEEEEEEEVGEEGCTRDNASTNLNRRRHGRQLSE